MNEFIQNLVTVTPPVEEPVSLALAKSHLRLTYTSQDALVSGLISAAREYCEKEVQRAFVTRTYELRLNRFPVTLPFAYLPYFSLERMPNQTYGIIRLPKPPLVSVDSISYVDNNGDVQPLDPTLYQVDAGGVLQGTVAPAYGLVWPQSRYMLDSVRVQYTAGYGAASDVPASIIQAMLLLIGSWYRNRESVTPSAFTELPMATKALLSSFKWGSYS
jgi:uncharacterized phiE125 gp8 family phage protein